MKRNNVGTVVAKPPENVVDRLQHVATHLATLQTRYASRRSSVKLNGATM
jgi:hypothetical protein